MSSIYHQSLESLSRYSSQKIVFRSLVIATTTEIFQRAFASKVVNYAFHQPKELGFDVKDLRFNYLLKKACSYTMSLSIAGLIMRVAQTTFQFNAYALYATCALSALISVLALSRFAIEKTRSPEPKPLSLSQNLDKTLADFIKTPTERSTIYPNYVVIFNPQKLEVKGEAYRGTKARLLFFFSSEDQRKEAVKWYKDNREAMEAHALFSSYGTENIFLGFLKTEENFELMKKKSISDILK